MKVFSYIVRYDVGFAPNPFHGVCSLATCKQDIRRVAQIDDWIVGTGSRSNGKAGNLVYAMRVSEIVSFQEYWDDERFAEKRPNLRGSRMQHFGDNIYHRDPTGAWIQENSRHSKNDGSLEERHMLRDTKSERVMLGHEFVYFGGDGPAIPESLRKNYGFDLVHSTPAYRSNFTNEHVAAVIEWVRSLEPGVQGRPHDWPRRRQPAAALA